MLPTSIRTRILNVNKNVLILSQDLRDDFELAYATVESKDIFSQDEKDLINGRLLVLEREIGKGKKNRQRQNSKTKRGF